MYLTPEESLIKAKRNNRDGWGEEELAKAAPPLHYFINEKQWAARFKTKHPGEAPGSVDAPEEEGY